MNCKPGDLAVVIGDIEANVGKVVTVLRGVDGILGELMQVDWVVSTLSPMTNTAGGVLPPGAEGFMADCHLRPIRDNDGQDETLAETWAGKPAQVNIPAMAK